MRRIHIREYQCNVCEKRFGYPTDLNRHKCPGIVVKEKIKEPGIRNVKAKQNSESEQFHCLECNYVTQIKVRLSSHIQRSHRKEFACDKCDKKFGYTKDLLKHQENIHSGSYFFCDQCSKVYKNKQIFDSHLKTHESGYVKPIYKCEHCFKSLTTKYSLALHMKSVHLGQKKVYLCQICGKKFSQRSSYKQHCNAHNGIKPYKCDICEKAFVYHKSLKEHKFMHDNIRRFTCVFCDKAFRQRTTLHIHLKTHKTVKDHICPVCGRGFAQKQAMERHERIHSGVRPYTCQLCNKSFGDTSTIRRHMISLHQKNETNWREDIQSSVKKKSDYYVFGGTGQNRVYKSNPSKKPSPSKKTSQKVSPKQVQVKTPVLQEPTEICQQEPSLIVLNPVQNNMLQDPNYINVFNGVQGQTLNGSVSNGTQNYQTFQTLQPGTLYAIAASQNNQELSQNQNVGEASPAPISNGFNQVIDFSTMTFVATKMPNQACDKLENGEETPVQQQVQVNHGQNTNMMQNATIVPLTPVSEGLTVGQPAPNTQVSSDSSLSQAIASIWGFVGYPSYQSPGNVSQFHQTTQNQ
jgi:KRAB domain-containing zinc finger protein